MHILVSMIIYDKGWWGDKVLGRMYGSAIPRALPISLLSAIAAALLSGLIQKRLEAEFIHPYMYQPFAVVVGFMVSFRCE